MYRHKWVYKVADSGEEILLSKGALLFSDPAHCEANGRRYMPSVDLVQQGELLLLVEKCLIWDGKLIEVVSDDREPSTRHYDELGDIGREGERVGRVPWCIETYRDRLYAYCIVDKDIWFYSHSDEIQQAYHDYIHMI